MRLSLSTLSLIALVSSGCSSFSGLWLFEFETPGDDNQVCTEAVDHNFTGATVTADDGSGQYTSERTALDSNSLAFVRFEDHGDGTGTLVMNNLVYPGTDNEDGKWTFEWTGSSVDSQIDSHELGYDYTDDHDTTQVSTMSLTFTDGSVTGDVVVQTLDLRAYTESDTWAEQVMKEIGDRGRIPAGTYLEIDDGKRILPVSNGWEDSDCDDADCMLTIDSDCTTTWNASGYLTPFGEEEYDAVKNSGQTAGI